MKISNLLSFGDRSGSIFGYNLAEPDIQDGPEDDIQPKHDVDVYSIMIHQQAAYNEAGGDDLNQYQRISGTESHRHELVMNVGLVRHERILTTTYTT